MAGPSHLSRAASYITHCSCPPLHLRPPETEAWESQGESAADASGLLFNLAATQQSGTHLSPALKVILNWLTHIHVYPRPVIEMNCGQQLPGCLERLKTAYPVPLWRAGPAHTPNRMSWKGDREDCSVIIHCKPRQSSHLVALAAKINKRTQKGMCLDVTHRAVWIFCFHNMASTMNILSSRRRNIKINHELQTSY